jgi:hypothetical protein
MFQQWLQVPALVLQLAPPSETFLYVQASEFVRFPDRSYRCAYCRRAAETITSGQSVLRHLRAHRTC